MQFIPSTWRIYGNGGNIQDPHDAILGAANLLRANGAPPQLRPRAPRLQPDSGLYVDAVTPLRARDRRRTRTPSYLPLLLGAVARSSGLPDPSRARGGG